MHRFVVSDTSCRSCNRQDDGCAFRVAWAINPHMEVGRARPREASRQHRQLLLALHDAGATVSVLPFVHGAFDSVFSKDNALLVERASGSVDALLARPRHPERMQEQRARADALASLGVRVVRAPDEPLEGGDVVMLPGDASSFVGHGFRTSVRACARLESFLGRTVTCLELRDPRLYHLDMVLSVLDDGTAVVHLEALTPHARRALVNHPAITSILQVPLAEALRFGVNLVQVERTVICGADAPRTAAALEARGYRVVRVPLDEFHRAGGSAACLVSRVHPSAAIEEAGPDSRRAA